MSHYAYARNNTNANNCVAKAYYFEKKLLYLSALKEVIHNDIDDRISAIVSHVEQRDLGTGREDHYRRLGDDHHASWFVGGLADELGLGDHPQDGDYLAIHRGINPRTGQFFVPPERAKQIAAAIEAEESSRSNPSTSDEKSRRLSRSQLCELLEKKELCLGFSSCVSLHKSISLVWGGAPDEERNMIERIFIDATRESVEYEESRGYIGAHVDGAKRMEGKGIAFLYLHRQANLVPGAKFPLPQLHIHIERPNYVILADGSICELDALELFERQREFGAIVDVFLFEKLKVSMPSLAAAMVVDYDGHGLRLNDRTIAR